MSWTLFAERPRAGRDAARRQGRVGGRPLQGGGEDPGCDGPDAVPVGAGDRTAGTGGLNANRAI